MLQLKQQVPDTAATRRSRKHARSRALKASDVSRERTAEVVILNMGVVLAAALGFALAVNVALLALHIQ